MSMYDKNHYNIVISLQLIKINEKKEEIVKKKCNREEPFVFTSKVKVKVAQFCPTLCNPGQILQARTFAWVALPFSR